MTSVTVKVTLPPASDSDDAITRSLLLPAEPAPSWDALTAIIQQRFSLDTAPAALTYIDAHGDEITVSSSEEVAELWPAALDDGTLSFSIGASQTRSSTVDTGTLLASVRRALASDPSFAPELHGFVRAALRSGGHSHPHKGCAPPLYNRPPHRHPGESNGKFGRGNGRRGGRGGFAGFHVHQSPHHGFDDPDGYSGSESETRSTSARRAKVRHRSPTLTSGGITAGTTGMLGLTHAFGPPPPFPPPPPPFTFGGFPPPPPFHRPFA